MSERRVTVAIWLFNTYLSFLEWCNRNWNRIRFRKWKVGYVGYGRLVSPWVMDKSSQETLRSLHDLFREVCPFNTISGNSGLHNTALHKMKLMFCVWACWKTGEIPFLDSDDYVVEWVYDAWEHHVLGRCVDGNLPEDSEAGRTESYCPFCAIEEKLKEKYE